MKRILAAAFALSAYAEPATAQSTQAISGRVLGDSARPLAGAIVSVTMAPDRTFRQDTTRADGRWRFRFDNASGDYLVHIAAPGRQAFRKRVTVPATDSLVIVDATLNANVQALAAVQVTARRPRPSRDSDARLPDGVSADYIPAGVHGAVSPELQGDLAALASTMPGITMTPNGLSAFGLGGDANAVTLNGLSFPGASLPRNAEMSARISTSIYDPSQGGFSGAQTAVTLSRPYVNTRRIGSVTLDAPQLQVTDRMSRLLGQRMRGGQASIGGSGELREDAWYYNVSADLSRRVSDALSVVGADATLFPVVGVSADSVTRFLSALGTLQIPATIAGQSASRVSDAASVAVRFDHTPYKPQSGESNPKSWALIGIGNLQRSSSPGAGLTTTPARGNDSERGLAVLQAIYSKFITDYSLYELRSSVSVNRTRTTPLVLLPSGNVLVSSALPDGTQGTSSLSFGGTGVETQNFQFAAETRSDYQWFPNLTHRYKLSFQAKFDAYDQRTSENALGSFGFASLSDLTANRPSSFSRTLGEPDREGRALNGFVSLGDDWRVSRTFQVIYGARLESNRFLGGPAFNPALFSALGVRTDVAPNRLHVSPRLGFSWKYQSERSGYRGYGVNTYGTFIMPPTALIRGGIVELRSELSPQLLAYPLVATGRASGARRIQCVGDAVPAPDWDAYASDANAIPQACTGSTALLTDGAPLVQTIDPSFDAPRTWRANLGMMRLIGRTPITIDGNLGLNLNQPSAVDANFAGVERFTAAGENRPVYSSVAAIVPATGLLSSVESRKSSSFGQVLSRRSDLHSVSRQLVISVVPPFTRVSLNASYTLASTRGKVRGLDAGAFGDPRAIEEGRSDFDVRHRLQLQMGRLFPKSIVLTMYLNVSSGLPYTPVVSGDVNGDGVGRDRAFVFNPSTTNDPALAGAFRSLLASTPANARRCLESQLGKAAARNSCEGPWTATANARIGLGGLSALFGRRLNASIALSNPLGGLDQLLHGEAGLRGWGTNTAPDPVLMTVRGFEPGSTRFRYEVNQRFGATDPARSAFRVPFRATLDISLDLGPPLARQQLERVLNRGRSGHAGQRLSADSIRIRFRQNVRSPYLPVIAIADSLFLSREQVDSLRAGEARFATSNDRIWLAVGEKLAALEDRYDVGAATRLTETATDEAWELAKPAAVHIHTILSPLQWTLAGGNLEYFRTLKGKIPFRYYSY